MAREKVISPKWEDAVQLELYDVGYARYFGEGPGLPDGVYLYMEDNTRQLHVIRLSLDQLRSLIQDHADNFRESAGKA